MNQKLRLLLLEDNATDAEMILHEVRQAGYELEWLRVETEADFSSQLGRDWEIILSDYTLPQFTGLQALALLQAQRLDIPFILVSGTIGEDLAVNAMKGGASDYLMKDRLARLGPAVVRAIADAAARGARRRADVDFAASEARYRRLFDTAKDGILILSAETGWVVDVNPSLLKLLDCSREQFIGEKIWELPSFREIAGHREDYEELQRKESVSYDDRQLHTADGHAIAVEFVSNLYLVSGHQVIQCNLRDITNRRRATALLAASEERYRKLFEDSPDGIANLSPDLNIIETNSAFARMHGYALEEIRSLNVQQLVAPASQSLITERLSRILENETIRLEVEHLHKDGHEFMVEVTASLITVDGRMHIQSCHRDISERKRIQLEHAQIERRLQEAQRLECLGTMAGGVAHDFNNLLGGILLATERVGRTLPAKGLEQESLAIVKAATLRAGNLCQQLLAYLGRGQVVVQNHSLNRLVEETTGLLKLSISKKAKLELHLDPAPMIIACDETQIRQVIMNFVINASEAIGDESGVIALHTRVAELTGTSASILGRETALPTGPYACLEVSDTGCGMSPETQTKIFDPFFTTKFTGRGLGLSAVHGIVSAHKGGLMLVSKLGVGTTFTLWLPLVAGGVVEPAAVAPKPDAKWHAHGCLLVVDDDDTIRDTTADMLQYEGFEVVQAVDGLTAVELFRAEPNRFDLVLMDLTMPRMNGDKAFIEMQSIRANVRVVIVSGYSEQEVSRLYQGNLPAGFLTKPFEYHGLLRAIRSALESK